MRNFRVMLLVLVTLACGCQLADSRKKCPATWEQTMEVATCKAKAKDYDFIMDHLLAPELVARMVERFGVEKWRAEASERELRHLAYYFDWLKKREVRVEGAKVFLTGEADCYATFVLLDGQFYILDFGQHIRSM